MGRKFTNSLVVRPQDLNHAGTLFGGTMMARADELAFIAASLTYPGSTFVTKVFHEFNFVEGATSGDIIQIEAEVLRKGTTSVTVSVRAVNPVTEREIFHTESIMVNAQDGKAIPIP